MPGQQRRLEPRSFLDASLVPLENALNHRAMELAQGALADTEARSEMEAFKNGVTALVHALVAEELRALAEELHHW